MNSKITYLLKFIFLSIFAIVVTYFAFYTSYIYESNDLEITFLNVDQGDCTYIKTPGNYRIFIDGGETGSYDTYIKSFLSKRKINHINSAVVSHFHSDHAGGILELIDRKNIDTVFVPKTQERTSLIEDKLIEACQINGVRYLDREIGEVIYEGDDGVKIKVWFPNDFIFENHGDKYNENNDSLVLILEYAGKKVLFMGDLEGNAEKILSRYTDIEADVLKVGHHGSDTSTTEYLLHASTPDYAVISCGLNNSYGFPHADVLQRLSEHNTDIFRTDLHGDITFIIEKSGNIIIKTTNMR